jgi:endonuclease/exonuclease/phosphatase family metal-dependent hydrolase
MKFYRLIFLFILYCSAVIAQSNVRLMTYNLLNYPGTDTTARNPYFRTIIEAAQPDILVVQEMLSQAGVNGFLNNVMNIVSHRYNSGEFIDGPDTDNAVFYDSSLFSFISNTPVLTALRDINEFTMVHKLSGDTLRIFSVHLKSSTGSSNENSRSAEVDSLRKATLNLNENDYYIVLGDFNIYRSTETAYQKLVDQSGSGYFIDILDMPGTWNNSAYSQYHTQSTRTRQFGGGANGGMDDRFDMILFSHTIIDQSRINLIPGSYFAFGNDGNHFNDSINRPPNSAVGQEIANALHYASDHLPVIAHLSFDFAVPVELISFTASVNNNNVNLNWSTSSEVNNQGFEIQKARLRSSDFAGAGWERIGFVEGYGTTTDIKQYYFTDRNITNGSYSYRLKQIDYDGSFNYSNIVSVDINNPSDFILNQNYPNPFNPSTTISYSIPSPGKVSVKVFDILGSEVAVLVNEDLPTGNYKVEFDAGSLSSNVYLVKLTFENYNAVRKIILMK